MYQYIAEDLGIITPDVTEMLNDLGFPGMAIMQFGFEAVEDGVSDPALWQNRYRKQ